MNILVVGGAGYIGSHMAKFLRESGHTAVVYDNLSTGHRAAVGESKLIEGELRDEETLQRLMTDHSIEAVIHFAASALVGESVTNPALYYGNNLVATYHLLNAMLAAGVKRIVFSSTCATYGEPDQMPITETTSQQPVNPYGFTKLAIERMLDDYAAAYGMGFAALRYFNACGSAADGSIGEDHDPESHLIPICLQVALGQRPHLTIFGDDYPTPDGTCIRDYIHVEDLCRAHLAALDRIKSGQGMKLNLGTGHGHSVQQVLTACREVSGCEIPSQMGTRRAGDPPELVADASRARSQLDWEPEYTDLNRIVQTAWDWHRSHPDGYGD